MGSFRFPKAERLSSRKTIETLFESGSAFSAFPLKVIYTIATSGKSQVLISVPARTFRKATDRNMLKRRIREGYRLNKFMLSPTQAFSLAYIYIAREILPSTTIHEAVQSSLRRLNRYEKKG